MISRFKTGDRVRLMKGMRSSGGPPVGSVGTVLQKFWAPYVEWDDFTGGHDGNRNDGSCSCWAVNQDCLELVNEQPWEVVLRGGEVLFTDGIGRTFRLRRTEGFLRCVGFLRCYAVPDDGTSSLYSEAQVMHNFANGYWTLVSDAPPADLFEQLRQAVKVRNDAKKRQEEARAAVQAASEEYFAAEEKVSALMYKIRAC